MRTGGLLFVILFAGASCLHKAQRLPAHALGVWESRQCDSNLSYRTTLEITESEWRNASSVRIVSDNLTNAFIDMTQVYVITPEGWRTTSDGTRAYAIALRRSSACATPFTEASCDSLHGLWGITNWEVGHLRARPGRDRQVTRELLWVNSHIQPHLLYLGNTPPEGRRGDRTPVEIDTNIVYCKTTRSNRSLHDDR
jgi:hypothetical protein